MANRIQLRRGTAAEWTAANPVLGDGEPGVEKDTGKVKYGNGVAVWSALPYASAGPQGPAGVADDTSVKDLITTPGTQTATALSATYASAFPATQAITYNPDGSVATVTENGVTTSYTYNSDGTVATDTRNGVTRTYTYTNGNLTGIEAA